MTSFEKKHSLGKLNKSITCGEEVDLFDFENPNGALDAAYSLGAQDMAKRVEEEVIGENERGFIPGVDRDVDERIVSRNALRNEQRTKLKQIVEEM